MTMLTTPDATVQPLGGHIANDIVADNFAKN